MIQAELERLGRSLSARAAGVWRLDKNGLEQLAFWSAEDMPREVADSFAGATHHVLLSETGLGIVRAAIEGRPFVSAARDLPPHSGSGLWLRRFGADRSIAVPLMREGRAVGVASVAVKGEDVSVSEILGPISTVAALVAAVDSGRRGGAS